MTANATLVVSTMDDESQVEVAGVGARLYALQFSDVLLGVLLLFFALVRCPLLLCCSCSQSAPL